jgi:hypothetical protein
MDATTAPLAPAPDGRRRIGEIFVELGFITSAQLEAALEVQRRTGGRIGEILVEQGSLTRLDLASALAEHWEPHTFDHPGTRPELSLGGVAHQHSEEGRRVEADHAAIAELQERLRAAEQRLSEVDAADRGARRAWLPRRRREAESALDARLAGIEERLDPLAPLARQVNQLQEALDGLSAVRAADAVALGARLRGSEAAIASLGDRCDGLEAVTAELRAAVDALARRPTIEDPAERLQELSLRLDRIARDGHDRVLGLADELRAEAAAAAAGLDRRLQAGADEARELRAALAGVQAGVSAGRERVAGDLAALSGRLDAQAAAAEEQARVTEDAVRSGLAALGKRLVGPEARYAKPGKGLRRSIDRLGAAIVEADTRRAGAFPVGEAAGYVAFVPTPDGYRLVELPGKLPGVGRPVQLEGDERVLLVMRHGRSPLPFDPRPCAYLDAG